MLSIRNVTVVYRGIRALNGLNAQAYTNDIVGIIGHNGAGKSTLIKTLTGRVALADGAIILDNVDISAQTYLERATFIASLHQNVTLGSVYNMTVEENLSLALFKGKRASFSAGLALLYENLWLIDRWRELFPHKDILKEKVKNLSGGQRQMLAFLIATAVPPKLLLLDEPTAALDPAAADRMMNFVTQFAYNHRIITLMVTHDLDMARTYCTKLWIIRNGTLAHEINLAERTISNEQLKQML